jgi:hypothetical protein
MPAAAACSEETHLHWFHASSIVLMTCRFKLAAAAAAFGLLLPVVHACCLLNSRGVKCKHTMRSSLIHSLPAAAAACSEETHLHWFHASSIVLLTCRFKLDAAAALECC